MYQYSALADGHIRVAELCPGQFYDQIVIILRCEPFELDNLPRYEALSYAWGTRISPNPVRIAGVSNEEIQVTHNLDVALRHLRLTDSSRLLWADSMCINQSNNVEKGAQVTMMGEIYHYATRVIVWLGPEEDESGHAMTLLAYMGSQVEVDNSAFSISPSQEAVDEGIGDITLELQCDEDDLTSIHHLLQRSWFERLWVRQEILLANDAAVAVCGSCIQSWQSFRRGLACVYLKRHRGFKFQQELSNRLDVLRSLLFGQQGVTLSTLRRDFGMLKCADPRDRVYAMLGILSGRYESLNIRSDYNNSVAQVYEDFVTRYLSHYADISILTACAFSESWTGPSWVPDWSRRVATRVETRIWSASLMFASAHFAPPSSTPVSRKLEVMGLQIGTIRDTRQFDTTTLTTLDMEQIVRDVTKDEPLADSYVAGGNVLEAYVRTMCLDAFAEKFQPPLKHLPGLDASIQVVRRLLYPQPGHDTLRPIGDASSLFLSKAKATLGGRCLYRLDEGYIGLGPMQTKAGDSICVILGSSLPMIMRHIGKEQYLLVGTCYTCGVGEGEALLGPLAKPIRIVQTLQGPGTGQQWRRTFIDEETGRSSLLDPRLVTWSIDHVDYQSQVEKGAENFLKVGADVWKARGILLQSFTLV